MTSVSVETGGRDDCMKCFRRRASYEVARALGRRQRLVSLDRLERVIAQTVAV
jgi:hypothetical protein